MHDCFRAARRSYRRARVDVARAKAYSYAWLLSVLNVLGFNVLCQTGRCRPSGDAWNSPAVTVGSLSPHNANDFEPTSDLFAATTRHCRVRGSVLRSCYLGGQSPGQTWTWIPVPSRMITAGDVARPIPKLNIDASPGLTELPNTCSTVHLRCCYKSSLATSPHSFRERACRIASQVR